jgi:alpha-galactosidase
MVCLSLLTGSSRADDAVWLGHLDASRILFFGNSITYHPTKTSIGWTGDWGMAATDANHDYVHLVAGDVAREAGATPSIMATYNVDWEQNYSGYNYGASGFQAQLAFSPTIVVVAIGENVDAAPLSAPEAQTAFATAFKSLLTQFKNHGDPTIFVRSEFWANPIKDGVLEQVAADAGAIFVDQSTLGADALNYAYSEPTNPWRTNGMINSHPGDVGMQAIADSLFGAMVAHSAPEPGTLALLGMAGPFVAGLVWRHRHPRMRKDPSA